MACEAVPRSISTPAPGAVAMAVPATGGVAEGTQKERNSSGSGVITFGTPGATAKLHSAVGDDSDPAATPDERRGAEVVFTMVTGAFGGGGAAGGVTIPVPPGL